jgi:hypothetical protein
MTTRSATQPRKPAAKTVPQYPADNGPLSSVQLRQIKAHARQDNKHSLRSSLLDPLRARK